ncbi:MAG: hypothetical protein ACRDOB_16440 [Streptosporangiaceae bacterium]
MPQVLSGRVTCAVASPRGGVMAGPAGRDGSRYASNGALRIAYELQGTMRWRRPWLVLIQGMGFDRSGWDGTPDHP